jgi:predicted transcriptional regulator
MSLNLNDLLKKAEKKGFTQKTIRNSSEGFLRPWQYESVLFFPNESEPESNVSQNRAKHEPNVSQDGEKLEKNSTQTQHKVHTNSTQSNEKLGTPLEKSEEKVATNWQQTDNKLETNRRQTEDKPETNRRQTRDKLETSNRVKNQNWRQTGDATGDNTGDKLETNWRQTGDKSSVFSAFSSLTGIQKKIIIFLYENCKILRSKITSSLSIEHIAEQCKITKISVKKSIQRLEKKEIIIRSNFKVGRGGWSKYEIANTTFQEILYTESQNKLETNWRQTGDKLGTQPETQPETPPLSSSSILNINKTTITADDEKNFLSEDWLKIDTSPLEHIYFSKTQLRQLVDKNIPDVVQESINYFSYEILQEPEKYTKPLNVLMGVLRQGNAWAAPKGYEAPKDKAQREYFERKKAENEKRNQFVSELMDLEFLDWQSRLSNQDLELIVPEDVRASRLTAAKTSVLKNYFKDQVLIPRLKNEGLY